MAKDELLFRPRRPGAHTTSQRNAPTATIPLLLVTPTLQPGLWLYSRPDTCFGPQMEMGIGVAGQGEKQNIFLTNALTFKYDKIESFKRNFWLTLISKLMTTIMFFKDFIVLTCNIQILFQIDNCNVDQKQLSATKKSMPSFLKRKTEMLM